MSDHISKLTTNLLELELVKVTKWDQLGLFLGLEMADIKEVELNHHELARRRMAMLDKWTSKQESASWEMVIEALENLSELVLANHLRKKYCTQLHKEDEKPQASISEELQQADPLHVVTERVLMVDYRKDAVAREIESLRDNYFKIIRKTESAVESVKPSERDMKRFSKYYT